MSDQVRVRIAPSPTGYLHVGTGRTALYNLMFARHNLGKFILRLEDTDEVRSDEKFTQDIRDGLHWLGLRWDEGFDIGGPYPPYRQTEKLDHYREIANELVEQGKAYYCYCSPEELTQLREKQVAASQPPRYDNRCRSLTPEKVQEFKSAGRAPVVRFRVEEPKTIEWIDAIRGRIAIDSSELGGDLIILKSSGIATYNFAVVIDDLDMKVSHVIRGEEHIHNGAKQLLIYEALGKTPPVFAHVSLMIDMERRKLSKRFHGEAVHISKYRKDGYLPEALLNYLIQMSWTHPEGLEIFSLEEACNKFDIGNLSKSPAVFDIQRLNWFNSNYIRSLAPDDVVARVKPFLAGVDLSGYSEDEIKQIVLCVRDGLTILSDIAPATQFFFLNEIQIPEEIEKIVLAKDSSSKILTGLLESLAQVTWGDKAACKAHVDALGKTLNLKGKDLYWPIRAALSGTTSGPDLGSVISILGQARVKQRLESALKVLAQS